MRIFGFLSIFLTKINTNSAKSCLLFRRKGAAREAKREENKKKAQGGAAAKRDQFSGRDRRL